MRRANAEDAHFLTDGSTFIAKRANMQHLRALVQGGAVLINPYHTLFLIEPTPGMPIAWRFGEFLFSDEAQAMLRDFGRDRFGEPMYNDRGPRPLSGAIPEGVHDAEAVRPQSVCRRHS